MTFSIFTKMTEFSNHPSGGQNDEKMTVFTENLNKWLILGSWDREIRIPREILRRVCLFQILSIL